VKKHANALASGSAKDGGAPTNPETTRRANPTMAYDSINIKDHPELWAFYPIFSVLHAVYHAPDTQSFPENERPHYFFVRRCSSCVTEEM